MFAVAATLIGADGAPTMVAPFDVPGGPPPAALVATTRNTYVEPWVRPVTVADVAVPAAVACPPAGLEVIVYPLIGLPLSAGATHCTVAPRAMFAFATTA